MNDDGGVLAAWPDRLHEVRLQDRVLRRTVEQNVDAVTFPSLDVLEPQMGNQLVEVLRKVDTRSSHQVIEVPKIFPVRVPQRLVESRPPQLAEQLVEVPTEPVYVLMVLASKVVSRRGLRGQGSTASGSRVVDNPVPQGRGGGGARGGLHGSRARQKSTANLEQIVDIQSSTASSSSRLRDDADVGFQGFFSHFSPSEKSAKFGPHSGSELLPESRPSTRRAYEDRDSPG